LHGARSGSIITTPLLHRGDDDDDNNKNNNDDGYIDFYRYDYNENDNQMPVLSTIQQSTGCAFSRVFYVAFGFVSQHASKSRETNLAYCTRQSCSGPFSVLNG
jgi:hypothetical protein